MAKQATALTTAVSRVCIIITVLFLTGCAQKPAKTEKSTPVEAIGIDALNNLLQKAELLYQAQSFTESKAVFEDIVKLDPKNLIAQYRLGNIAFRLRDWQEALFRYRTVTEIEPKHTRAQYNLAMTHLTLAERHLKFYAANVDRNTNLDTVTLLVQALEEISNPNARRSSNAPAMTGSQSSLDKLLDELLN